MLSVGTSIRIATTLALACALGLSAFTAVGVAKSDLGPSGGGHMDLQTTNADHVESVDAISHEELSISDRAVARAERAMSLASSNGHLQRMWLGTNSNGLPQKIPEDMIGQITLWSGTLQENAQFLQAEFCQECVTSVHSGDSQFYVITTSSLFTQALAQLPGEVVMSVVLDTPDGGAPPAGHAAISAGLQFMDAYQEASE